jgi:hypothetical protein
MILITKKTKSSHYNGVLRDILKEFELGYNLSPKLTKTQLIGIKQKFARIVKN